MIEDCRVPLRQAASFLLALGFLITGFHSVTAGETGTLTGPYFGQEPPGIEIENARQRQLIEETVYDSIAWALTKDRARLESIIAHDEDYFSFHPDGLDGVHGYSAFGRGFELWMDPRFEATSTDVRKFRCHLSRSGEVAWFSAILDDCYTWDGEPGCWKDTRWTGVLEKREGRWLIVQMHFSFAADRDTGTLDEAEVSE